LSSPRHQLGLGGFLDVDDEHWRELFNLNLFSAVWMTRAALPSLLDRRGAIVNIASINSHVPADGPVGYSEAKAALTALSKRLSEEFGPSGARQHRFTGCRRQPSVARTARVRRQARRGERRRSPGILGRHP
jgi:NAD(P)-dependent dehydrogenase (short-subunit alcohol dehydrogenase family)